MLNKNASIDSSGFSNGIENECQGISRNNKNTLLAAENHLW